MSIVAMPVLESTSAFPIVSELSDVDVVVSDIDLTVVQAALIMRTTEKHIHRLIAAGRIPYREENGEPLISQNDFLDFMDRYERGHAAIDRMMIENIEMGLYDMEFNLEEYNACRRRP